ncbi:hypothetical protein [Yersinia enterocolitica]|uniref:hypothetical protein n=1 Tax=Yersinia enterocolitica TaxID=630 RepID=UPI003D797A03
MVAITIKPAKENSKTRKFKRTGEFFAAKDANRVLASRIEAAFTELSEGCTSRVYKATMPYRFAAVSSQARTIYVCLKWLSLQQASVSQNH